MRPTHMYDHAKMQPQGEEANQLSLAPQAPHAYEYDVDIEQVENADNADYSSKTLMISGVVDEHILANFQEFALFTMSTRLCTACNGPFTGPHILRQSQPHHQSVDEFLGAAKNGCYICSIITSSPEWNTLVVERRSAVASWYLSPQINAPLDWLQLTIDCLGEEPEDEYGDESSDRYGDESSDYSRRFIDEPAESLAKFGLPLWKFTLQPIDDTNPASELAELPAGLEDPAIFDVAKLWIEDCRQYHPLCRPAKHSFNPTRLVHIVDESNVKVVTSQHQAAHCSYVTFSHCWGKSKTIKLQQANKQQLYNGISCRDLPVSYKEVLSACLAFGFSYVWIDSLCIIQDSKEDWTREAAAMRDIYENSNLNISCCAAAENSEASFQCRDRALILPLAVEIASTAAEPRRYQMMDGNFFESAITGSPLFSRAWVFQETFLARRTLCLTESQLFWQCRHNIANETYPQGAPPHLGVTGATVLQRRREGSRDLTSPFSNDRADRDYDDWTDYIEAYTGRNLTQLTDKLVAFSGVAQKYRDNNNLKDDDYIAGLWKSQLPLGLCWTSQKLKWTYRPRIYRAPSWSWASIEGQVVCWDRSKAGNERLINHASAKLLCEIIEIKLHYFDEHYKTGPLKGGYICLRGNVIGPLKPVANGNFTYSVDDKEIQPILRLNPYDIDETTEDGESAISYLDSLQPDLCQEGYVENASRVFTDILLDDVRMFFLPIFEETQEGSLLTNGLLICQLEGQPPNIFQRIGQFENMALSNATRSRFPPIQVKLI